MNTLFKIVYSLLVVLSEITGLSYKEINVVAYFYFAPAVLLFLVDRIIKRKYICSIGLAVAWVVLLFVIPDFSNFSNILFDASANFLRSFAPFGMNYVVASVVVCVVVPGGLFLVLLPKAFPGLRRKVGLDSAFKSIMNCLQNGGHSRG